MNLNKLLLLLSIVCLLLTSCTKEEGPFPEQKIVDFEELSPGSEGYWNGSDGSGGFKSGELELVNNYNSEWQTWDGFSYSDKNDIETAGFVNQYSVFDALNENNRFLIFFPSYTEDIFASFEDSSEYAVKSIKLCNNTYTGLSMRDGDNFSKKFGGESGDEEDWFKVTISGYNAENEFQGSVDFYLADYRESDNREDYIIEEWTHVDLTSLGMVNKLTFSFDSSDMGDWGINTPTYVCVDNLIYEVLREE